MHAIHGEQDRSLVRIGVVRRWPQGAPVVLGVVLVSAIAALDGITGPDVSVSLLYALAVMAVTWAGTRRHGYLAAALAAADSLAAQALGGGRGMVPRAVDVWNAVATFVVLAMITALVGALRRALIRQRRLATVDPLTGAMNRRAFQIAAERERLRSARDARPLSIAYLDLDGFKGINDRLGHRTGDRLLSSFARLVDGSIRGSDLFARIGGDEFVVLLPDTDARAAVAVLDRIRAVVARECIADIPLTLSIGIATFRFPPPSVDGMVAEADRLMYRAKRRGGAGIAGAVVSGPWLRWNDGSLLPERVTQA